MMNKRSYAALALLLALAACGGSGNDHGNDNGQAANPGPTDAFLAKVQALIGTSPDNTEPESIDAVAVTTPETTEPAPL
ncbi:hypothetical protein [Noviherbaspirillum soli]|uniref:hypothetical protein n=1 Tax=Noviherbaspirillum soli TaxID=1064518 RepID=UPI00188AEB0B|nr:hypothetical protein [Noviherbaspirillum soli]